MWQDWVRGLGCGCIPLREKPRILLLPPSDFCTMIMRAEVWSPSEPEPVSRRWSQCLMCRQRSCTTHPQKHVVEEVCSSILEFLAVL